MWRIALILVGICWALLLPSPVQADTSQNVTVTAAGYICEVPGGFTLTYISDHEVQITWTKGDGAAKTMIRAKYGSYPEDVDDGYLVYYGDGESCSDTAVSLDETATAVHYRAWSEDEYGAFTAEWVEGTMEGIGVTLIALVVLTLGLTVTGFWQRRVWLFVMAGLAWFGFGIYGVSLSGAETGEILWILGWIGLAMSFMSFGAIWWTRERPELEDRLPPDEEFNRQLDADLEKARELRRSRRFY